MREFLAFSEEGANAQELSSQQHQALLAIRAHPGPEAMSVGELADCLLIKPNSAVGLVQRMTEADLIVRIESLADRRRVLLQLTPQGLRVLSEISVRNLGRLNEAAQIISAILRIIRALGRRGLWARKSI